MCRSLRCPHNHVTNRSGRSTAILMILLVIGMDRCLILGGDTDILPLTAWREHRSQFPLNRFDLHLGGMKHSQTMDLASVRLLAFASAIRGNTLGAHQVWRNNEIAAAH